MRKINRVFMFANYTPSDDSIGITKKIRSEIRTLREMCLEVYYTGYGETAVYVYDNNDEIVFCKNYPFLKSSLNRKIRYYWLEKTALDFLKKYHIFDLGYIRLGPPNRVLFRIFEELKKNDAQIIAESLAYFPGIKYRTLGGKYITYCFNKNGKKFKDYISYFLCEGNFNELFGIPAYTMNIGVDVDAITPHQYIGKRDELNLISVGNENLYHAYDRIIESVRVYKGERRVIIHLVGTVSDQTKKIIDVYGLQDRVILYGKKQSKELDSIYNQCNVGLGPFGQHRIGGKKDTGLKTKEYFAKGLPYIYSGEEPTVPNDYPYVYCFPSDESPIDFDKVWDFYKSYAGKDEVIRVMREFAKEHYSWQKIMKDALSHLEE